MPKLKVRKLEWYMDDEPEESYSTKYVRIEPLLYTNGYYKYIGKKVYP